MNVMINKIHQLTANIRAFELISTTGAALPAFSAGSHIDVLLKNGLTRQYSLSNCSSENSRYVIGVLYDPQSRGGSACLHQHYKEGDLLRISEPRNLFAIDPKTQRALLFAGGIGITPILAMAYQLKVQHMPFELHYFVRSHQHIAFYGNLMTHLADHVHFHIADQVETECDMPTLLAEQHEHHHLYVCGPQGFMDFVINSARHAGWQDPQIHKEHFVAEKRDTSADQPFMLEVKGYQHAIEVAADQTAANALQQHGFSIALSCEQGICGSCMLKVVDGIPEHRDVYLTDAEHATNTLFTPCCSRAKSNKLVIEISG